MSSPARVLVVSGSAGHGHVKAGQAVTAALEERHPTLVVEHWDALDHLPRWYARTYQRGYVRLVDRHPLLWRRLYEASDASHLALGHWLTRLAGKRFVADVDAFRPDLVLCTHFLAPEVLSAAIDRRQIDVPIEIVVTDHDAHRSWHWPHVRHAYVASEHVAGRFQQKYGMAPSALSVTGIPVRAAFAQPRDVEATRVRYGLDPSRPTLLFLSGGFAAGPLPAAVAALWRRLPDAQVLAVCGTNQRLRESIARLARPPGALLHALGFVEDVPDLMAVADLVVSKSGGITTSECMAVGRPLLISAHIAGQEERNADAVTEAGAGARALSVDELVTRAARLLEDPPALARMAACAKAFGRPEAAWRVADLVAAKVAPEGPPRGPRYHGAP